MALITKISHPFGDGEYEFDVGPLGIRLELEEKCGNTGLLGIHKRLQSDCLIMDYRETIRLGLIGGGLPPIKALTLVKRYVEPRPAQESVPLARIILMAGLVGVEEPVEKVDEAAGKETAETASTGTKPASPSADQLSTEQAQPSASLLDKSTSSPTGNSSSASKGGTKSTAQAPRNPRRPLQRNSTASSKNTQNAEQVRRFTDG